MSTRPTKRQRTKEGDIDKVLMRRRDILCDKMTTFLECVHRLVARYQEAHEAAKRVRATVDPSYTPELREPITVTVPSPRSPKKVTSPRKARSPVSPTRGRVAGGGASPRSQFPSNPPAAAKRAATPTKAKEVPAAGPAGGADKAAKGKTKKKAKTEKELEKERREAEDQAQREELPLPPDNSVLLDQISVLKHEAHDLSNQMIMIGEWITLMLPVIKEEDPLGAQIQMVVHTDLMKFAKDIETKHDLEFVYLEGRANLESNYYKHYLAPTWGKCIEQLDRDKWDEVEMGWVELWRITYYAYQSLCNNMEKLKDPKPPQRMSFMM